MTGSAEMPLPAWVCAHRVGDMLCVKAATHVEHGRPHRLHHVYGPPGTNRATGQPGCDGTCENRQEGTDA